MYLPPANPDGACARHGYELHAFVHEAGHCVIAAHHGISFDSVSVARELGAPDPAFGDIVAGGLDMGRAAWEWVPEDPVCALEMLAAGMAAEAALLGHFRPEGYNGDLMVWRRGTGLTGDLKNREEVRAVLSNALGELFGDVVTRGQALVRDKLEQVATVAMAIHASPVGGLTNRKSWPFSDWPAGRPPDRPPDVSCGVTLS